MKKCLALLVSDTMLFFNHQQVHAVISIPGSGNFEQGVNQSDLCLAQKSSEERGDLA